MEQFMGTLVVLILLTLILVIAVRCTPKISKTNIVVVKTDTLYKTKINYDTIKLVRNDTVIIEITKTKTEYKTIRVDSIVYEKCNDRTERVQARLNHKTKRDSLEALVELKEEQTKQKRDSGQQIVKINDSDNKKEIKQTRIENRSKWWAWLLIGLILGFFVRRNLIKI